MVEYHVNKVQNTDGKPHVKNEADYQHKIPPLPKKRKICFKLNILIIDIIKMLKIKESIILIILL